MRGQIEEVHARGGGGGPGCSRGQGRIVMDAHLVFIVVCCWIHYFPLFVFIVWTFGCFVIFIFVDTNADLLYSTFSDGELNDINGEITKCKQQLSPPPPGGTVGRNSAGFTRGRVRCTRFHSLAIFGRAFFRLGMGKTVKVKKNALACRPTMRSMIIESQKLIAHKRSQLINGGPIEFESPRLQEARVLYKCRGFFRG